MTMYQVLEPFDKDHFDAINLLLEDVVMVKVDSPVYRVVETDAAAVMPGTLVVQEFTADGFKVRGVLVEVGEDKT
jgi:hypothetical protein